MRVGLGAVVKYSPLDQEVLCSSGLSAHLCGGKACLAETPPQTPPSVGASKHWVRPIYVVAFSGMSYLDIMLGLLYLFLLLYHASILISEYQTF